MNGIIHVEDSEVEATTGQMLITFVSGGDKFRFHLPPHVALGFRRKLLEDGWQIICAPDADLVKFKAKPRKAKKP